MPGTAIAFLSIAQVRPTGSFAPCCPTGRLMRSDKRWRTISVRPNCVQKGLRNHYAQFQREHIILTNRTVALQRRVGSNVTPSARFLLALAAKALCFVRE